MAMTIVRVFFFVQAEDGIRDGTVTGVQTCALPISGLVAWLAWRLIGAGLAREGAAGPAGAERVAIAVGAAVAGLAFGVHPLRAESVAWATDRGDVLCATFYLAALVAYARGVDGGGGLRWRPWGTLALLAMTAALLSKEIAATLPAVLLILDA